MKKIGIIVTLILVSGFLIFATTYQQNSNYFPASMEFATEKVPLHMNDVRERMDRELLVNQNLHSSTQLIIKRAAVFFPIIEPILAKYNVPDDFKYLAVIESSLITTSVSKSGACGIWQFMKETALEKGLEISETVDERYHVEKSTEAACQYLLAAKTKFGSWTLAAASYNGGMGGIAKQIESQQVDNYYDLLLTEETSRYVFRILALKEIMKNPVLHGFNLQPNDLYKTIATRQVEVDTAITNLASFAKSQGINYKILKLHNAWLRDKKLDNANKKKYSINIATEGY
jgi:hypothetical protein